MSQTEKKYFSSNDARDLINHYGFALFPVHGVVDGVCTCGSPTCDRIGKHPATQNGLTDATKDIDVLKELWTGRKGLNVGIATGEISGIFVIDIDSEQGEKDLAALGALPQTLMSKTSRGKHLFFKYPNQKVRTRTKIIGQKVDVRGDGGYVAGAGSNHESGVTYEWVDSGQDIAYAPQWLLDIVTKDHITHREMPSAPLIPLPRLGNTWTLADATDMLRYLDPNMGYDDWIKVGMALNSEGFDFTLWDNWSRGAPDKYKKDGMMSHWRSFTPDSGISFGTVVKWAQERGWRKGSPPVVDEKVTVEAPKLQVEAQKLTVPSAAPPAEPQIVSRETSLIKPKAPMIYTMARDITPNLESNDFVKGLLGENQLSVIYGESNCGKTFFMTDLGFHVSMGREWRSRRVDQGGLIYAALEGSYGLKNRVAAYRMTHGLDGALFAMVATQIDFLNPEGNIGEFIDCIKRAADEMGSCKMVVIDTLARAMAGGDENSGQDMGMLVYHADRIRYETGAHVSFVHHSGKNRALGARGHSSLRAAVDTEIEISRDEGANFSTIRIPKQREMEADSEMFFTLEKVSIGISTRNEEITSCVVGLIDGSDKKKSTKSSDLTPMQEFVLEAVVQAMINHGEIRRPFSDGPSMRCITYKHLKDQLEASGYKEMVDESKLKNTTNNIRVELRKKNRIGFNDNLIWLLEG